MIQFEWDSSKARSNKTKHGVGFKEASSVFYDDFAVQFEDANSIEEERFLMLGLSNRTRLLLVVHCFRESDETIRIVSARKATAREKQYYKGAEL